jgi:hypothetical protein
MSGAIPPLLQYASMAWCSVKAQGQLYLLLYGFHFLSLSLGDISLRDATFLKVHDMRPLEHWDRGFESHSRHGCVSAFFCLVLSCVGRGLAFGRSPVQGVLPTVQYVRKFQKINSEPEQAKRPNP